MVLSSSDIVLVVVSIVFFILLFVGCIYFLVYFQHPADRLVAWFPKVVVVIGLLVACTNVLLLPLDVATQGLEIVAQGLFPMQQLEYAFFLITIIFFFAVVPFAYLYYEGYDEDEFKQSVVQQVFHAIKWTIPLLAVMAGIITAVYWFYGFSEFDLVVYTSPLATNTTNFLNPICIADAGCTACSKTIDFRVSPVVYIIAIVNLIGFVVLVSFGGVGWVALPLDLILEFKNRPRYIRLQEYTKRKITIGQRSESLLRQGEQIQKEKEEASKLKKGKRKAMRKVDRDQKEFKQSVLILEKEYKDLTDAYQNQGGNILLQWAKFLFGLLAVVLSFFWILHIILYVLPQVFNQPPIASLLNGFFEEVSKAPIFGPLFYGLFSFYMLMCVIKGNVKLGFRFVFFTLFPLKLHDTMMNAFLFNTGLILAGSLAVVQLCTISFSEYARFTSINGIFYAQISNLRGVGYIFDFFSFAILGFALLTLIYLLVKPYDRKKDKENQKKGKEKAHDNV